MRTKGLKIIVIVVAFLLVVFISKEMRGGGNGPLNPILVIALYVFSSAVWKWEPKGDDNDQDKHILKKD